MNSDKKVDDQKAENLEELKETPEEEVTSETDENFADEEAQESAQEDEQNAKYLRLMADFQNYKRRSEKEKSDIYAYANEKILAELLGVIDDFDRALSHEADSSGGFFEGMQMIFKNFKGVLEKAGLEEIEALGEDFDPNFHNAVMTDANSKYESGKVCEVIQKGYKLGNRVVRPSMVKVSE